MGLVPGNSLPHNLALANYILVSVSIRNVERHNLDGLRKMLGRCAPATAGAAVNAITAGS